MSGDESRCPSGRLGIFSGEHWFFRGPLEGGLVPAEQSIAWSDPADLPDVHVDLSGLDDGAEDPAG